MSHVTNFPRNELIADSIYMLLLLNGGVFIFAAVYGVAIAVIVSFWFCVVMGLRWRFYRNHPAAVIEDKSLTLYTNCFTTNSPIPFKDIKQISANNEKLLYIILKSNETITFRTEHLMTEHRITFKQRLQEACKNC